MASSSTLVLLVLLSLEHRVSGSEACAKVCADKTHPWTELCSWNGCGACSQCSELPPALALAPPPATPPPQCKTFCERKTHPWTERCSWNGCGSCSECSVPEPPSPSLCTECSDPCAADILCASTEASHLIDFSRATLRNNNLGGQGPDASSDESMYFASVGTTPDGSPLNLRVTALTPYMPRNALKHNLINGAIPQINLGQNETVTLRFDFVSSSGQSVVLRKFFLTCYDLDQETDLPSGMESVTASGFVKYDVDSSTELDVGSTSDGSVTFTSSQPGVLADNPTHPTNLTAEQRARSVTLWYRETSTLTIIYSTTASVCSPTPCGGRNLLFAGVSAFDPHPCCVRPPSLPTPPPLPPVLALAPPPASPPPQCKTFCEHKTHPWTERCSWNGCGACSECSVPEPLCKTFCEQKTQPWTERCSWNGCGACSQCSELPPVLALAPPPAPPPPQCKTFCERKTHPWTERCSWNGCGACSQCSVPAPPSPPPSPSPFTSSPCTDVKCPAANATTLDFSRSVLENNNLGGGSVTDAENIYLASVGMLDNMPVDLNITALGDYVPRDQIYNTLIDGFMQLNLDENQTSDLLFEFVHPITKAPVELNEFVITFYDIDLEHKRHRRGVESVTASGFDQLALDPNTQVKVSSGPGSATTGRFPLS